MPTPERKQKKVELPFSRKDWLPAKMVGVAGRVCQGGDLVILGSTFFTLILLPYFSQQTLTFEEFLQLRISLWNILAAVFCMSAWRVILWSVGLYTPRRTRSWSDYLLRLVGALLVCTVEVAAIVFLSGKTNEFWRTIGLFVGISLGLMLLSRAILLGFYWYVRPRLRNKRVVLIVGTGPRAWQAYKELLEHPVVEYEVLGFIDADPQHGHVPESMILGGTDNLEQLLMNRVVDEVVIALPVKSQYEVIGRAVAVCQQLGIQSQYTTDQFGTPLTKRRYTAGPQRGRMVLQVVHHDYRRHLKRTFDLFAATLLILLLSPILIATAIAVKLTSKGPMLFHQERIGLNKRKFYMLKFRSMVVDAEAQQAKLEHLNETKGPAFKIKKDPRITLIGGFIRKDSIDELPQLFNVLKGDMSLVGPRPLPIRDVSRFAEAWLMRRFSVLPGLTCLWQVSGRSNTDFDEWIELDLQYIDQWSLTLDVVILVRTIPAVLRGRGAS